MFYLATLPRRLSWNTHGWALSPRDSAPAGLGGGLRVGVLLCQPHCRFTACRFNGERSEWSLWAAFFPSDPCTPAKQRARKWVTLKHASTFLFLMYWTVCGDSWSFITNNSLLAIQHYEFWAVIQKQSHSQFRKLYPDHLAKSRVSHCSILIQSVRMPHFINLLVRTMLLTQFFLFSVF